MSYNIDHIENLSCDLHISRGELIKIMGEFGKDDRLPESSFLMDGLYEYLDDYPQSKKIPVEKISWRGESSGSTYDYLVEVLSHFKGTAELVLFWEGGDTTTGLRVKDGKVTECDVEFVLKEKTND